MNKQETAHWLLTAGLTVGVVASLSIGEYNRQQLQANLRQASVEQSNLCLGLQTEIEAWRLEATGRDMLLQGQLNDIREVLGFGIINTGIAGE